MSTHHNINREIPGEIIRLTTALDDIERVALPAPRALKPPPALPAARERDVEGVFVFLIDIDARMGFWGLGFWG